MNMKNLEQIMKTKFFFNIQMMKVYAKSMMNQLIHLVMSTAIRVMIVIKVHNNQKFKQLIKMIIIIHYKQKNYMVSICYIT
jgi:hypothetical protein